MPARRYGILSDVHGNYAALAAALAHLDRAGVDRILNLGDMVGYGKDAPRVIDTIRARHDIVTIQGNHERMLIDAADAPTGSASIDHQLWAQSQLTGAQLKFLRDLPEQRVIDDTLLMIHSSLVQRDGYIMSREQIRLNLEAFERDYPEQALCFFGHTHLPMVLGTEQVWPSTTVRSQPRVELNRDDLYLINPGSVGQPRDRSGLTALAIFDAETWTIEFVGLPENQ
ncbi:MAG TPA: metallophosphoesterase family protein [Planctomycetota bacterium]|nr:metallophosphoesterase family protein [Planctomycetota bacterium]